MTQRLIARSIAILLATLAPTFFGSLAPLSAQTTTRYVADLIGENVVLGGAVASAETAIGRAHFTLTQPSDASATTLSYLIEFETLDLDGLQTPGFGNEGDNVTAIHLHDVRQCVSSSCVPGDTAGTLHVLNIFGIPRGGDDDDMTFDPVAGTVMGLWDDGDADPALSPAPTFPISQVAGDLSSGHIFLMVHNNAFPNGALGGFLRPIPEPSSIGGLVILVVGLVATLRSGRRLPSAVPGQ